MTNRYPLVALLGGVVPNTSKMNASIPSFGIFETQVAGTDSAFSRDEVRVQPATSLELMALADWATRQCTFVHLRAPATATGQQLLAMMTKSVESFQTRAASASTYSATADVLSSTQTGCVIAIGSDADVQSWYTTLPLYPNLHLLTLSGPAMCVMVASPNISGLSQASRLHFPTIITGTWNTTVTNAEYSEPWKYGYVLGQAVVQALTHSQYDEKSYTTPAELLSAWYTVKVMTSGALTLGPYDGDSCTTGQTECQCNEGVRSVAIRSVASTYVESLYSISTCHVVYIAFRESEGSNATLGAAVGAVAGFFGFAAICAGLYWRLTKRSHSAAPKDVHKPFCVLFTDIQASTHLWATIPDIMTNALHIHHTLIRRLLLRYNLYEVKTIGDSFMCATRSPANAVDFALALQRELFEYDWGTDRIDTAYIMQVEGQTGKWTASHAGWNGLRVRVGIHYGLGEVVLDPVTKGYDYYGTVVNTAARVEAVCHGGQIGITQAVYDALVGEFPGAAVKDLGEQQLRGLTEPVHLYQLLPSELSERTFPPLRLERAGGMEVELNSPLAENGAASPCRARSFLLPPTPSRRSFNRRQQRAAPATVASPRMSLPNGTAPSACSGDAHGDPRAAAHGCGSPTQLLRAALSQTLFQRASAVRGEPPPDCRLSVAEHNMATSFPRCPIQPLDSVDDDDDVDRPSHLFAENLSPMQFDGVCCGAPSHSDGLPAPPWTPTTNGGDDRCVHPAASLPV
eukprot:GGOE01048589.1.p1 GENE.GGOE01048589.1~~GGOE01048589.1.p1  ORF type:complete len:760 (-),score=228.21 GGOE01048589.1:750-2978(-)